VLCAAEGRIIPATVADHHPRSRRELQAAGLDPDDPAYGRGLCELHHNRHTARAQPGGFNGG
jgi:5-methylcytosine-specific restriction protein A